MAVNFVVFGSGSVFNSLVNNEHDLRGILAYSRETADNQRLLDRVASGGGSGTDVYVMQGDNESAARAAEIKIKAIRLLEGPAFEARKLLGDVQEGKVSKPSMIVVDSKVRRLLPRTLQADKDILGVDDLITYRPDDKQHPARGIVEAVAERIKTREQGVSM